MSIKVTKGSKKLNISKVATDNGNAAGLSRVYFGLEWTGTKGKTADLDIIAVICGANGKALNEESIMFFGMDPASGKISPCKSTKISEDNQTGEDDDEANEYGLTHDEFVSVILSKLPAEATHVDILTHMFEEQDEIDKKIEDGSPLMTFGDCEEASIEIIDLDNATKPIELLDLAFDNSEATTIKFGKLMKKGADFAWVPEPIETMEFDGNLTDLLIGYGANL